MGKYTRHINAGEEVEICGEKFTLKASTDDKVPFLYFQAMKIMKGIDVSKDADMTVILDNVSEEIIGAIIELTRLTFQASYPEEDVKEQNTFINQNIMELFPIIFGVYSQQKGASDDKKRAMDRMLEMQKKGVEGTPTQNVSSGQD